MFDFQATMLSKMQKGYMSVDSDSRRFTMSSKLMAARTAVDINRNTQHLSAEVKRNDGACELSTASDCNHSAATTAAFTANYASETLECISGGSSSGEARPILRPPKKRKINLTSDESTDQCVEVCQTAQFSYVSPPLPRADLTEWKGHRVLARNLTDSIYRPGLIRSISTSHGPVGIQFDGSEDVVHMSADNVISDSAPPSSGIFVGMRVCARIGLEQVEYRLGMVRERILQPPVTKFLVELDVHDGSDVTSPMLLSRASLRLMQVGTAAVLF